MQSIKVVLFVSIMLVISDAFGISHVVLSQGLVRRKREKHQKEHISNMKEEVSINILHSEKRNSYPKGSYIMCPMFDSSDENTYYSAEFIEKFVSQWREKVYTPENYPLTYNDSKPVNISSEIMQNYQKMFCPKPRHYIDLLWIIIILISIIPITIIVCDVIVKFSKLHTI